MQFLPIYLYANKLDVTLDLDATIRGVNQVMYQRDLTIQKGIKNQIKIQFKNSDQKRISISTSTVFVFSMFDAINQRIIVEKRLEVLSETTGTKGLALLTLTESDTLDLDKSSYTYSVKKLDTDGTYTPAYANTYYGMNGTIHLNNDVSPVLKDSTTIVSFNPTYNSSTHLYEHKSGNIYASPEFNGNSALHTAAVYMTAYKGTVLIQGTLDNTPTDDRSYDTIETRVYTGFTGIDYINFNGVYTYIRILHIPAAGPPPNISNNNSAFFGSLDKVLYRS
jgi:hypothetical protein